MSGVNENLGGQARNLVFCFDGTANNPLNNDTNVIRIANLARDLRDRNIVYYDPGVGTLPSPGRLGIMRFKTERVFGKITGHGIIQNIAEAYAFLCEHYAPGDRLFLFGFSRGAYTARLLASAIHQVGLLPKGHSHLVPYAVSVGFDDGSKAAKFSAKLQLQKPNVNFLGLFDCVKSALFFIDRGWSPVKLTLPFSWYNPSVRHVRHAMAIDETRALFPVNRWAEFEQRPDAAEEGGSVKQVWFAGNHCDVGGGNTENGFDLSAAPLDWMLKEARMAGLDIAIPTDLAALACDHRRLAEMRCHDESKGRWRVFELLPTFSANEDDEPRIRIMNAGRGRFIPYKHRKPLVHASVRTRLEVGKDAAGKPYRPLHLISAINNIEYIL